MSRIGNAPVLIPSGVTVTVNGAQVDVNGPKGSLSIKTLAQVMVKESDGKIVVSRKAEDKFSKSLHGLTRSLINNMVLGVSEGFTRGLEMVGVGYRAQGGGDTLTLSVGFSHPVTIKAPD